MAEVNMEASLDVANLVFGAIGYIEKLNDVKFSKDSILRAFYMEVILNIDLLDTIQLSQKERTLENIDKVKFRTIMQNLHIEVASSILYGAGLKGNASPYRKALKVLSKLQKVDISSTDSDDYLKKDAETENNNLFHSVVFVIRKIAFLKTVAASPAIYDSLPNLYVGKRLENIRAELHAIRKNMKPCKEINVLRR